MGRRHRPATARRNSDRERARLAADAKPVRPGLPGDVDRRGDTRPGCAVCVVVRDGAADQAHALADLVCEHHLGGRVGQVRDLLERELRLDVVKTQKEMRTAQHDYGKDEGDRVNTSLAKEIRLGQKSRDQALLNAVDVSLKRISEGTFGECLNCGQEINAKRLEAIPWVRYCITCQELIDSTE